MKLETFRKKRVTVHQKKMGSYLKYVLNDHFVLVLIFLLGAGGYFYSEFLKNNPDLSFVYVLLSAGILSIGLLVGKIATLLQPADVIFLTPLEEEMHAYIRKMTNRSMVLPFLFLAFLVFAIMPLLVAVLGRSFRDAGLIILSAWLLKGTELKLQEQAFTSQTTVTLTVRRTILLGISFLVFLLGFIYGPFVGVIVAAGIFAGVTLYFNRQIQHARWNWHRLIEEEEKRLFAHYRLINLFTDVPVIQSNVKRNRFLDSIFDQLPLLKNTTYGYLYSRVFARQSSYRNLYLRLIVVGGFLQWLSPLPVLNVVFALLFLYLIGFQVLPIYNHFDGNVFVSINPVSEEEKKQSLERLMAFLLVVAGGIFSLIALFQIGWLQAIVLLLSELIFIVLFIRLYTRKRIQKFRHG